MKAATTFALVAGTLIAAHSTDSCDAQSFNARLAQIIQSSEVPLSLDDENPGYSYSNEIQENTSVNEEPLIQSVTEDSENPVPSDVPLPLLSEESSNEVRNKRAEIFEVTDISDDAFFYDTTENYENSRDTDAATLSVSFEQPNVSSNYAIKSAKKALRYRRLKGGKLEVRD